MNHTQTTKSAERYLHAALPFVDFLYILQLEDYNSKNYARWVQNRLFQRGFQKVALIQWTPKAKLLLGISFLLYVLFVTYVSLLIPNLWWMLLVLLIISFLTPYIVLLANILFSVVDVLTKAVIVRMAQAKLQKNGCTVVAIVGSQGKTSTRMFLVQLLEGTIKTQTPRGNFNVPLSIAKDILRNLKTDTQVYVVEFGELYRGDLQYLDQFLQPAIIILTSITSQHVAQFGSQSAIDQEFTALLRTTKAMVLANGDDVGVTRVGANQKSITQLYHSGDLRTLRNKLPEELAAPHVLMNIAGAFAAAKVLKISDQHLINRVPQLTSTDRRLQVIKRGQIIIIDDSYNISPESAGAALHYLSSLNGRKVVVTGGIVDQGQNESEANKAYGRKISRCANVVVVAANRLAPYIQEGIGKTGSKKVEIHLSPHPTETPHILQKIIKPGDIVLVQNELPDLYWS